MAEEDESLRERRRRILKMMGLTGVAGASGFLGEAEAVNVVDGPATNNEIIVNVLVEDLNGDPIEGAIVELEDRGGSPDDRVGTTDTDGRIKFIEGVGPPPENCQTLKLKLMGMDRVKNLGCRNAPATVSATFQVDREKLRDVQDDMDPLPEGVSDDLDAKNQLIDDIQDAADSGLIGDPTEGELVDTNAQDFVDDFQDNYLSAGSQQRTQYAEGLKRLIQAEKITEKAVDSDGSVRDLTRQIANAGIEATIAIAAVVLTNIGGAAARLGSKGELLKSTISEIKSLLKRIRNAVLGLGSISRNRADKISAVYDEITDDTDNLLDRLDLIELGEEILGTSLGNSEAPPDVKSFILDQIDENEDTIGGPVYADHIFRVNGDLINDDGTYDTGLFPTRPGETGVVGIHESIQDRTSDIREAIRNSEIYPSKTLGEDPVNFPANRIEDQVTGANKTLRDLKSIEFGVSIAEVGVVAISIAVAASKGTASKLFRQLSTLSAVLASSYVTLTVGRTVTGTATLGTVREEHDFGTNELINPEETGI